MLSAIGPWSSANSGHAQLGHADAAGTREGQGRLWHTNIRRRGSSIAASCATSFAEPSPKPGDKEARHIAREKSLVDYPEANQPTA